MEDKEKRTAIGYDQRRELMIHIRIARSAMQLLAINFKRMGLADLKRVWRETYRAARDAGIIE